MLKGFKKKLSIGCAFLLIATIALVTLFSRNIFAGETVNVSGVVQSGDNSSFAKSMPFTTIILDQDTINDHNNTVIEFSKDSSGKVKYPGFVKYTGDTGANMVDYESKYSKGGEFVVYDQAVEGAVKLAKGKYNTFGANGDVVFTITYKGAAVLPNGDRADVVMSFSDINIVLQDNLGTTYDGKTFIVKGNMIRGGNTTELDGASSSTYTTRNGLQLDINIQVVDTKTKKPVEGTFFYPMKDIDVERSTGGSTWGKLYGASNCKNYSEQIRVNKSKSSLASDIYVPEDGYLCEVTESEGGILFYNQNAKEDDPGTFKSGFAVVVDNSKGIGITVFTSGANTAPVRTFILGGGEFHKIVSSTTKGGNIRTTYGGNKSGKLDDGNKLLGPGAYEVPDGKTAVYTMTPESGWSIKSVLVGDKEDGSENTHTFSKEELENLAKDPTVGIDVPLKDGVTGKLRYDKEAGSYVFEFPGNNYDHKIHVSWVTNLGVSKTVTNTEEKSRYFPITVDLSNAEDGTYSVDLKNAEVNTEITEYNDNSHTNPETINVIGGKGSAVFWLRDSQSIEIQDLAWGTGYKVYEEETEDFEEGYRITSSGTIVDTGKGASTGDRTITGPAQVAFNNAYIDETYSESAATPGDDGTADSAASPSKDAEEVKEYIPVTNAAATEKEKKKNPVTGDDDSLIWVLLATAACAGIVTSTSLIKRKRPRRRF